MLNFDEASARLTALAHPLGIEKVAVTAAVDRTLAEDAVARIASPGTDVSAMDGFAVCDDDLDSLPVRLPVALRVFPGDWPPPKLPPRSCARVFTGSPLPAGATRVVMQEDVEYDGNVATFSRAPAGRTHVRACGSDMRIGDLLAPKGTLIGARALATLAGGDLASVTVCRRPRIALVSTGDELVPPGQARLHAGRVPDSVSLGLIAFFHVWGGHIVARGQAGDDLPALVARAGEALNAADLVVVTGGASVGERDHAKAMFAPHGLSLVFNKVAIKPGKPVWLGQVGKKFVLGLPGNPSSALVTARLFAAPLIAGLAGRSATLGWRPLPVSADLDRGGAREQFMLAREVEGGVAVLGNQDSSMQRTLIRADLLVRRPPSSPAQAKGSLVETLNF